MLIVCKLQKQTSVPHLGIHGEELRPGQEAQSEHSFALHKTSFTLNYFETFTILVVGTLAQGSSLFEARAE